MQSPYHCVLLQSPCHESLKKIVIELLCPYSHDRSLTRLIFFAQDFYITHVTNSSLTKSRTYAIIILTTGIMRQKVLGQPAKIERYRTYNILDWRDYRSTFYVRCVVAGNANSGRNGTISRARAKAIAQWTMAGSSPKQIADAFGLCVPTVTKAFRTKEYAEAVGELQTLVGRATHMRMSLLAPTALKTLEDLMDITKTKSEFVRYRAADTLLTKSLEPQSPYAPQRESIAAKDPSDDLSPINLTNIIINAYEDHEKEIQPDNITLPSNEVEVLLLPPEKEHIEIMSPDKEESVVDIEALQAVFKTSRKTTLKE